MGILKNLGKFFGWILFSSVLGLLIFILALLQLTDYSTLKPIAADLISQQLVSQLNITEEQLNEYHAKLVKECTSDTTYTADIGKETITINCSQIKSSAPQDLVKIVATSAFDKIYYKKYDCEFLQCLQQEDGMEKYTVILSPVTQQFFKNIFNYLLFALVVSGIILFASIEGVVGRIKAFGSCFIAVGLSYFFIPATKNLVPIPAEAKAFAEPIINQMLDPLGTKLLIIFVIGVVLTATGFIIEHRQKRGSK